MRVAELLRQARRDGWSTTPYGSGHWRLDHPDASRAVIVPATPSDRRWHLNALAEMRRVLPPQPKPVRVRAYVKRRPPTQPVKRPVPALEVEQQVELPMPPRRIAGGPEDWRSPWSRLW
jgi:predicted RNA binding protein YcfA (HicA-like mRNA interferase family)